MAANNGFSTTGIAFLTGAMIGAGAALLMAPYSGAKTRRLLKTYADDTQEEVMEKIEEAMATLNTAIKQGKKFVNGQATALNSVFESGKALARRVG
jgi:gas vesicle protein